MANESGIVKAVRLLCSDNFSGRKLAQAYVVGNKAWMTKAAANMDVKYTGNPMQTITIIDAYTYLNGKEPSIKFLLNEVDLSERQRENLRYNYEHFGVLSFGAKLNKRSVELYVKRQLK